MKFPQSFLVLFVLATAALAATGCSTDNNLKCFDDTDCPLDCFCQGDTILPFDCVKIDNPDEFCFEEDGVAPADDCSDVTPGDGLEEAACSEDADCDSGICCTPDKTISSCDEAQNACTCQENCLDLKTTSETGCDLNDSDLGNGGTGACCNIDDDCDSLSCNTDVCECQ